jgi:hypothetical protein
MSLDSMGEATAICGITLLGVQSYDPSLCIEALESLGCEGAEKLILDGREKERVRREARVENVTRALNKLRQNGDLISEDAVAHALREAGAL